MAGTQTSTIIPTQNGTIVINWAEGNIIITDKTNVRRAVIGIAPDGEVVVDISKTGIDIYSAYS
jgi:uncharacterized protein YigE (DUF2233 family)